MQTKLFALQQAILEEFIGRLRVQKQHNVHKLFTYLRFSQLWRPYLDLALSRISRILELAQRMPCKPRPARPLSKATRSTINICLCKQSHRRHTQKENGTAVHMTLAAIKKNSDHHIDCLAPMAIPRKCTQKSVNRQQNRIKQVFS